MARRMADCRRWPSESSCSLVIIGEEDEVVRAAAEHAASVHGHEDTPQLRERGPVLIACPTCGRLQFDMDRVVAEVEQRLEAYEDPIEVSVLGCAVNGIGEARHADFGITGAKDMGMIYSKGEPLKKVPTEQLVDELFKEIDRYYAAGKRIQRDETAAAQAREWLAANEDASAMTPERIAALEAAAAENDASAGAVLESMLEAAPAGLDEIASPVAGRRFSRS